MPAWGQLIQYGAEMIAEMLGGVEKACDRGVGVFQFFHVRNESVRFDRIAEIWRRLPIPFLECGGRRQMIKGVVDLDRVEHARIMREPLGNGQLFRVKRAAPMFVVPTRRPNSKLTMRAHIENVSRRTGRRLRRVGLKPFNNGLKSQPRAA